MPFPLAFALALSFAAAFDPYERTASDHVSVLVRAAQFGEPGADAAVSAWLAAHPDAPSADRLRLNHRLCRDFVVRSAHAAAARACSASRDLGGGDQQNASNSTALAEVPPMRAIGSARLALVANAQGSRDARITVGGVSAAWLIDTGAEITVVSQSLATRIGVRLLKANIGVGSTTGDVHGGLGVIDLMQIGDAQIENVPVLVLPDAQLKIGDLPQIQAILGLPVFVAFRRAAWLDGGKELALGEQAPAVPANASRLYWHEEGLGLPISTDRGTLGAHLDTGANASYLRHAAHGLLTPAIEATARAHGGRMGGAGGIVATREMIYPHLQLSVAGTPITLNDVSIEEGNEIGAARIGDDVVRQLSLFLLDFEHMRVLASHAGP